MKKNARTLSVLMFLFVLSAAPDVRAHFLESESDYYKADETAGHVHQPNAQRIYDWPEYESRKIFLKTNNLGFREDQDTETERPSGTVRVLVTGDSHTDGVVNNGESFPNLLENMLNEKGDGRYEVLNGGTGYYTFRNYLGFLKKYLYLKPDVFIAAVYTGNDFLDTARLLEAGGMKVSRSDDYTRPLYKQSEAGGLALSQSINQIYYFRFFPQTKEPVLQSAAEDLAGIKTLCEENGISFLAVLLPAKADVEWARDQAVLDELKAGLSLTAQDLTINKNLTNALKEILSEKGVVYLDLSDAMSNQDEALFWKKDHHLNPRGHRVAAETLYDWMSGKKAPAF